MSATVTKVNHIESVHEVLDIEARAILNLKEYLNDQMNDAIELINNSNGRVIVMGMGKSGLIGKKMTATFSSTGTPSLFLHPAEGLHGDLGMVTANDVIIAISNSGETEEIIKTIPSIKRIGAKMIAIVGKESSTLAEKSDVVLSTGNPEEACPLGLAPTTSTTVTLALGDALAIALLKARNFTPDNFALYHPGGSLGKKLLLTVENVVSESKRNPIAKADAYVKDVLFEMTKYGMGAINLVDHHGKLVGILTDGDIRRALSLGSDILEKTVDNLYNPSPITVSKENLAAEALNIMDEKCVNVLPVVDDSGQPIAMVHMHDLTKLGL